MSLSISFPNVSHFRGADFVYPVGEEPGCCEATITPQSNIPSSVGDLVISDGERTLTFVGCAVDRSSVVFVPGQTWKLRILDRRWKWRYPRISGHWNERDNAGTKISATTKTPQQLATILLDQMGETGYDISAMPNTVYPEVIWDDQVAAKALRSLCDLLQCWIYLDPSDDTVKIVPIGNGTITDYPFFYNNANNYNSQLSAVPQKYAAVCEPDLYQSKFELEAVGRETDDSIVAIGNLSYKPAGGWGSEHPSFFHGVAAASRPYAFESVYRWYRIKQLAGGGFVPNGYLGTGSDLTEIGQLMPVSEDLITLSGGDPARAYVEGGYTYNSPSFLNISFGRCPVPFRIDTERNIVVFESPVWKLGSAGEFEAAELYLTATHGTKVPEGGPLERHSRNGSDVTAEATDAEPVFIPGLRYRSVGTYSTTSPTGNSNNLSVLNSEADAFLNLYSGDYLQYHTSWGGLHEMPANGCTRQIRWILAPDRRIPVETWVWFVTESP